MAEFCLECSNRIDDTCYKLEEVVLSKEPNLCEGCGKYKRTVVCIREDSFPRFELVFFPFYLIWQILKLPYTIYKYIKGR